MARAPRLGIVVPFFLVCVAGGGLAVYKVGQAVIGRRIIQSAPVKVPSHGPVFAIQSEAPETAQRPLIEVLHGLDFVHDAKALLTFDLAIQTRLREARFDELDACAADLERAQARFPGGGWELFRMMDMLSNCPGGNGRSDAEWGRHLALFRNWVAKRPSSWTAREALAGALVEYAWKARGDGFVGTVKEEDWLPYTERLQQAVAVLHDLPRDSHRSPMWYYQSLVAARALSMPRSSYDKYFEAGIAQEPGFFALYTEKAYDLLPRWDGEPGEWERFTTTVSNHLGGAKGDLLYFYIVRAQCESIGDKRVLSDPEVDWQRVKRGRTALKAAYGETNNALNEYCLMAGMKGDRDEALAMIAEIKEAWDPWVWKRRPEFDDFHDWALQRGRYAGSASASWSPLP